MREITVTARDGRVSQLEQVYIRGSMVSLSSVTILGDIAIHQEFPHGREGNIPDRRSSRANDADAGCWIMDALIL